MSIRIPTLRSDDALGFLAAVGLVALSEQGELPALRLSWEGRAASIARLHGEVGSVNELAGHLEEAFTRLIARDEVVPGIGPDFPVPRPGGGKDPMRMTAKRMAEWYARADRLYQEHGEPWFARWLIALTAQATVKDEKRGDVQLTPFYAPTGQMAMRTSIFEKTMEFVREVDGPGDAVQRWRKTSFDGANFDDRAKRDAGVTTSGKPDNQGAPSPTWLAAMAMRLFPLVDDGHEAATVGWQRFRMYPGFTSRSLVWPSWEPALDGAGVRTLLAHPAMRLGGTRTAPEVVSTGQLEALGVTAVFGASRRTLSQGDGPLGPARRLWVRPG